MSAEAKRETFTRIMRDSEKELAEGPNSAYLVDHRWYDLFCSFIGLGRDPPGDVVVPPIDNSRLIRDGFINTAACEGVDYKVLTPAEWNQLHAWYGGGPAVPVPTLRNRVGRIVAPSRFYIFNVKHRGESRRMQFHNLNTGDDVEKRARSEFSVGDDVETRVVVDKSGNKCELVGERLLKEYQLRDNDPVILDYKENGAWNESMVPRAHTTERNSSTAAVKIAAPSSFYASQKSKSMPFGEEKQKDVVVTSSVRTAGAGTIGLDNLGNTCYFNSGVQCLLHTRLLMTVFLTRDWQQDLNRANPLGMRGALAEAFAALAKKVWSGTCYGSITPRELRDVTGRFAHQFSGYQQQDAHELVTFMLDGIHEDLNRCRDKPVVEPIVGDGTNDEEVADTAWQRHKLRNDSVIVDLFHAQLRSELTCPNCNQKTIVFDPYMTLSVPVQKPHHHTLNFVFVPYDVSEPVVDFRATIAVTDDINEFVSGIVKRDVRVIMVSYSSSGYDHYGFGIRDIAMFDTYYAVEIPDKKQKYVLGQVRISREDLSVPIAVPVPDFDVTEEDVAELFKQKLSKVVWEYDDDGQEQMEIEEEVKKLKDRQGSSPITMGGDRLAVKFRDSVYDRETGALVGTQVNARVANRIVTVYVNPDTLNKLAWRGILYLYLQKKRSMNMPKKKEPIRLEQCLEYFSMEEILDEQNKWFCPRCREFVCAQKKMDIWSLADNLVIQLKRFVAGRVSSSKKYDGMIEFPDELDMSSYVLGPQKGASLKYRLYAVSEHSGGLGGGHYTARCLVAPQDQSEHGGHWHYFNDSMCRRCSISDAHTTQAYILFYERIENPPSDTS